MNYKPLVIGDLFAKIPLIQGGMGVGISLGGLAGAVAKEGGIGIISTAQIGFKNPIFKNDPFKANIKAINEEFSKAKGIAPNGIVGFNIMVALNNYKEYVLEAIKVGADVIISGAGLAVELPLYIGEAKTKFAPIVSTSKSAKVLLKLWERRYKKTADFIVIEGPLAGGHLGFKKQQIESYQINNYDNEIKEIISIVREYEKTFNKKIPIVVAGGIDNNKRVNYILNILGADGIQIASSFVPTFECDASDLFKNQYINAKKEDIVIINSPVGMIGRAIRNDFIKNIEKGNRPSIDKCYNCLKKCDIASIPYCITQALINSALGDINNGLVFCGANTYNITKIKSVKEVINEIMDFR